MTDREVLAELLDRNRYRPQAIRVLVAEVFRLEQEVHALRQQLGLAPTIPPTQPANMYDWDCDAATVIGDSETLAKRYT